MKAWYDYVSYILLTPEIDDSFNKNSRKFIAKKSFKKLPSNISIIHLTIFSLKRLVTDGTRHKIAKINHFC